MRSSARTTAATSRTIGEARTSNSRSPAMVWPSAEIAVQVTA